MSQITEYDYLADLIGTEWTPEADALDTLSALIPAANGGLARTSAYGQLNQLVGHAHLERRYVPNGIEYRATVAIATDTSHA